MYNFWRRITPELIHLDLAILTELSLKTQQHFSVFTKCFFLNRIVGMWNSLPLLVQHATTIADFKKGVGEYLVFSKK